MGRSAQRQTNEFVVPPHRVWPLVAGVATIALGAGVLIAGVPRSSEAFVMPADVTTTTWVAVPVQAAADVTSADVTVAVASAAPVPSTTVALTTMSTTTVPTMTPSTTVPSTTAPSTTAPSTTAPSTTAMPTATTDLARTTIPPRTPVDARDTPDVVNVEPARVSVVVVNGTDEAGLAGRTAGLLAGKGYTETRTTDARQAADRTTIFYAPGFEDEAAELAGAMGWWAPLEPKSVIAITVNGADADADLVLLLGPSS